MRNEICPCGTGKNYDQCCLPYISGAQNAPNPEALMRSRYSAYVKHDIDYIIATCSEKESQTVDKAQTESWSKESTWLGLQILSATSVTTADTKGDVEFIASYIQDGVRHDHHEKSGFIKLNGKWLFDYANVIPTTIQRVEAKTGRNEPCPCGSGKKYKQCHGK